jgi:hypothetical protein
MQRCALLTLVASVFALASAGARAADAPPPAPPTLAASAATAAPVGTLIEEPDVPRQKGGEPVIQRTVIEDRGARIEELRVRGSLQKVTVAPKGSAPGYEILTGDGYHATADDPGTSRGSAGKRVWNVLRF